MSRSDEQPPGYSHARAGFTPESVATAAGARFGIGDHPDNQLAAAYNAAAWLEHNDDWNTTETDQADTAAQQFGLDPRHAQRLVTNHRQTALKAWADTNLPDDLLDGQAQQRITEQWGNSPYADTVQAQWHHRQQEQQQPHRGRGGLSL